MGSYNSPFFRSLTRDIILLTPNLPLTCSFLSRITLKGEREKDERREGRIDLLIAFELAELF